VRRFQTVTSRGSGLINGSDRPLVDCTAFPPSPPWGTGLSQTASDRNNPFFSVALSGSHRDTKGTGAASVRVQNNGLFLWQHWGLNSGPQACEAGSFTTRVPVAAFSSRMRCAVITPTIAFPALSSPDFCWSPPPPSQPPSTFRSFLFLLQSRSRM
jgi:hypothetical protein